MFIYVDRKVLYLARGEKLHSSDNLKAVRNQVFKQQRGVGFRKRTCRRQAVRLQSLFNELTQKCLVLILRSAEGTVHLKMKVVSLFTLFTLMSCQMQLYLFHVTQKVKF